MLSIIFRKNIWLYKCEVLFIPLDTRTDVRKIERFAASATIGRFVIVEEDVVAGTVVVVAAVIDINKIFV